METVFIRVRNHEGNVWYVNAAMIVDVQCGDVFVELTDDLRLYVHPDDRELFLKALCKCGRVLDAVAPHREEG